MAGGKRRWLAPAFGIVLVALVGIQFVPVERTNPPVRNDLGAPAEVDAILRGACYDCHSNETRWPWYARVAPMSWFLSNHVEDGRREMNFSEWPVVDFEAVQEGEMPLRSYKLLHPEARLTPEQVEILVGWARGD